MKPDQLITNDDDLFGCLLKMAKNNTGDTDVQKLIQSLEADGSRQPGEPVNWGSDQISRQMDQSLCRQAFEIQMDSGATGTLDNLPLWCRREILLQEIRNSFLAGLENRDDFRECGQKIIDAAEQFPGDPYLDLFYRLWKRVYEQKK